MKRRALTTLIALLAGYKSSPDERLVEMANEHEKSQSEQSQEMARTQQRRPNQGMTEIVQFGSACWSFFTPAAVAWVLINSTNVSCFIR